MKGVIYIGYIVKPIKAAAAEQDMADPTALEMTQWESEVLPAIDQTPIANQSTKLFTAPHPLLVVDMPKPTAHPAIPRCPAAASRTFY